jgi:hypothetical protein
MSDAPRNTGLIIAIVFAAVSISATLVFFGMQLRQSLDEKTAVDDT